MPLSHQIAGQTRPEMLTKFNHLLVSRPRNGVCHCQISRPPVNALNTAVWSELLSLLTTLEENEFPHTTRVVVFSSAVKGNIFSAGNDLNELYVPGTTKDRFKTFWLTSTTFLARLYISPLYTIAAIRGATPAGGCVMSLCCDYRLALSDTSIGLNEVAIGLAVPHYWAHLLIRTSISKAQAERMLAGGRIISSQEAYKLGLIDKILSGGREHLLDEALREANEWARKKGVVGRARTKRSIRRAFAEEWEAYGPEESENAWSELSSEETMTALGRVMKQLSQRSARM